MPTQKEKPDYFTEEDLSRLSRGMNPTNGILLGEAGEIARKLCRLLAKQTTSAPIHRHMVGGYGNGKSHICECIQATLEKQGRGVVLQNTNNHTEWETILKEVILNWKIAGKVWHSQVGNEDDGAFIRQLAGMLKTSSNGRAQFSSHLLNEVERERQAGKPIPPPEIMEILGQAVTNYIMGAAAMPLKSWLSVHWANYGIKRMRFGSVPGIPQETRKDRIKSIWNLLDIISQIGTKVEGRPQTLIIDEMQIMLIHDRDARAQGRHTRTYSDEVIRGFSDHFKGNLITVNTPDEWEQFLAGYTALNGRFSQNIIKLHPPSREELAELAGYLFDKTPPEENDDLEEAEEDDEEHTLAISEDTLHHVMREKFVAKVCTLHHATPDKPYREWNALIIQSLLHDERPQFPSLQEENKSAENSSENGLTLTGRIPQYLLDREIQRKEKERLRNIERRRKKVREAKEAEAREKGETLPPEEPLPEPEQILPVPTAEAVDYLIPIEREYYANRLVQEWNIFAFRKGETIWADGPAILEGHGIKEPTPICWHTLEKNLKLENSLISDITEVLREILHVGTGRQLESNHNTSLLRLWTKGLGTLLSTNIIPSRQALDRLIVKSLDQLGGELRPARISAGTRFKVSTHPDQGPEVRQEIIFPHNRNPYLPSPKEGNPSGTI